jgi:hypothetical protein
MAFVRCGYPTRKRVVEPDSKVQRGVIIEEMSKITDKIKEARNSGEPLQIH